MEKVHAALRCQHCSSKLVITGLDELQKEQTFMSKHPEIQAALGTSSMVGGKLDESFIVLDPNKQAPAGPSGQVTLHVCIAAVLAQLFSYFSC